MQAIVPLGAGHEAFCHAANIEHYRALLDTTTDAKQREVIEKLLLEEEAKLKQYDNDHKTR